MRLNRFYAEFNPTEKQLVIENEGVVNQVRNVLRLTSGSLVQIFNGRGTEALGAIELVDKKKVDIRIDDVFDSKTMPDNRVILYCAVLKKENFELVAQKATEIGVAEIVPVITERTIKLGLNMERLNKIVVEACEQSGRGFLPKVLETVDLSEAFELAGENDVNLFFDFSKTKIAGKKISGQVGLFVGPEGGWSEGEVALAKKAGCKVVSLGDNVLRAETAAIVGSYLGVNL
ncbi:MAG: RsmE family RNA methyltransferase [bacterium]